MDKDKQPALTHRFRPKITDLWNIGVVDFSMCESEIASTGGMHGMTMDLSILNAVRSRDDGRYVRSRVRLRINLHARAVITNRASSATYSEMSIDPVVSDCYAW